MIAYHWYRYSEYSFFIPLHYCILPFPDQPDGKKTANPFPVRDGTEETLFVNQSNS